MKIGRNAGTGRFVPVREAERDKRGAVVETIKPQKPQAPKTPTPPKRGR